MPNRGYFPPRLSSLSIPPPAFVPGDSDQDWVIDEYWIKNKISLDEQGYRAPVIFPNGLTVTKLTLHGFRDNAFASMYLQLIRNDKTRNITVMALIKADWTDGASSKYEDTIEYATIDNVNYTYLLWLKLNPNDSVNDVKFYAATIEFAG